MGAPPPDLGTAALLGELRLEVRALGVEMRALLAELRTLHRAVARRAAPAALTRSEQSTLARLLPAIAGALGSEPFAARELVANRHPALCVALDGVSAKRVGKLLARAEGIEVGGFVVQRGDIENNIVLWSVLVVT